jgi:hypothetical protein
MAAVTFIDVSASALTGVCYDICKYSLGVLTLVIFERKYYYKRDMRKNVKCKQTAAISKAGDHRLKCTNGYP